MDAFAMQIWMLWQLKKGKLGLPGCTTEVGNEGWRSKMIVTGKLTAPHCKRGSNIKRQVGQSSVNSRAASAVIVRERLRKRRLSPLWIR